MVQSCWEEERGWYMYYVCLLEVGSGGGMDVAVGHSETWELRLVSPGTRGGDALACGGSIVPSWSVCERQVLLVVSAEQWKQASYAQYWQ